MLDPDRKKMSKSKGNVVTPLPLVEEYGADGVRYWAGSARLGVDTALDEKVFKVGKRLVTKLFNAGKFVLAQSGPRRARSRTSSIARSRRELRALVARATRDFEDFNHAQALQETETFFWSHFTDTYLELAKVRARDERPERRGAARGSAVATLRLGLVGAAAPVRAVPAVHHARRSGRGRFAAESGPAVDPPRAVAGRARLRRHRRARRRRELRSRDRVLAAIHKAKSDAAVSVGREVARLTLAANAKTVDRVAPVLVDVLSAARCARHRVEVGDALEDAVFEVREIAFAQE